jgi:SAM-dependent methyltransferase
VGGVAIDHWDEVWGTRAAEDVSWYEEEPTVSVRLVTAVTDPTDSIIDVGAGASRLVDHLLAAGYRDLTVVDVAAGALDQTRARLGPDADLVEWVVGDVTTLELGRRFDLWHDRAVLHFLVERSDLRRYLEVLRRSLNVGGHVVLATFGPQGPESCSGLPVRRYDAEAMQQTLGDDFEPLEFVEASHTTPTEQHQAFLYGLFRRTG